MCTLFKDNIKTRLDGSSNSGSLIKHLLFGDVGKLLSFCFSSFLVKWGFIN